MPVTRSVRRDVILRVPKVNIKAKQSTSSTGQILEGLEAGGESATGGGSINRRSMSPTKRMISQPESTAGSKGVEPTGEGVEDYKYAALATSAAEWNSLLIWARRQRGPQWDAATGM